MKHRKQKHPKNCRNFPQGKCNFGEMCYYVHPNTMEVTESEATESATSEISKPTETPFKCHTCGEEFTSKNAMMKHKKAKHTHNIACREFPRCRRSAEHCWYKHETLQQPSNQGSSASPPSASPGQGFQQIPSPLQPPDQMTLMMDMLKALQSQMNTIRQDVLILKQ